MFSEKLSLINYHKNGYCTGTKNLNLIGTKLTKINLLIYIWQKYIKKSCTNIGQNYNPVSSQYYTANLFPTMSVQQEELKTRWYLYPFTTLRSFNDALNKAKKDHQHHGCNLD